MNYQLILLDKTTHLSDEPFNLTMDENPYYSISNIVQNDSIDNGISFNIQEKVPRLQIPLEYLINLKINYDKEKHPLVFYTPDNIRLRIINKGIRKMTIEEIK